MGRLEDDLAVYVPQPRLESNAIIQLFNVPWDSGYRNLRYFSSKAERDAWFDSRVNQVFPNADAPTIVVDKASPMRVGYKYTFNEGWDARHNWNYLRFWNREYPEGEWQYCFIDNWMYVGAHAADCYFHIDSWINNIGRLHFGDMFIERENTDTVNDLPEPVTIKRHIYKLNKSLWNGGTPFVYMLIATAHYSADPPVQVDNACVIDGVNYNLYSWITATYAAIDVEVQRYAENGTLDRIVGVFAIPQSLCTVEGNHSISFKSPGSVNVSRTIGSYTPKHSKCLRYPYCYCIVSDFQKSTRVYKWEDGGGTLNFGFNGATGMSGILNLVPGFKNSATGYLENMSINTTVPVGYSGNGWANWMAQNQASIKAQVTNTAISVGAGLIGSAVAVGGSIASGGVGAGAAMMAGGAIMSAGTQVAQTANSIETQLEQGHFAPNPAQMPDGAMMYLALQGMLGFVAYSVYPSSTELKALDAFFDRYGYTVNRIGKPNIHGAHYYIKVSGATVYGMCPQVDRNNIMDALERGVTFWNNDSFSY